MSGSCFMWTLRDVLGLVVAGLCGLFALTLFVLLRFDAWRSKRLKRVSK